MKLEVGQVYETLREGTVIIIRSSLFELSCLGIGSDGSVGLVAREKTFRVGDHSPEDWTYQRTLTRLWTNKADS